MPPRSIAITILALAAAAAAAGAPRARAEDAVSSLGRRLGPGAGVAAQSEAGTGITFIGTRPGAAIPLQASTPRAAALEAGERFGARFGLGPDAALHVSSVEEIRDGSFAAHLQQTIAGVPVLGGELAVGLDPAGDLLSIGGELEPAERVDASPAIAPGAAAKTAIAAVAKETGAPVAGISATTPELGIYDPRILGGPGLSFPRPVWRLEVSSDRSPVTVRDLVLVDADLGNVALSFSEIEGAKNRIVCNAKSEPKLVPCTEGLADLVEGDGPVSASAQVNAAYNLTGALYDFYQGHFGRDSIDNAGMPLVSTVNYCENTECPFENAFWNGEQMVYGDGMVTDDVTGHELTHGVNGSESNLFYYYQSGALDEALADIFGELFDLSTPDAPADRWKIGEDSAHRHDPEHGRSPCLRPAGPDRVRRMVLQPERRLRKRRQRRRPREQRRRRQGGLPDHRRRQFQRPDRHRAGRTRRRSRSTYHVAADMLTSASDYQDYGNDLRQSCSDLVGEHEITAADCEQVEKTVLATEMETPPADAAAGDGGPLRARAAPRSRPSSTTSRTPPAAIGHSSRSEKESVFFFPRNRTPTGLDATYANSGTRNIWGVDAERGLRLGDRDDEKRHRPRRRADAVRPRPRLRVRRRQ